MRNDRTFLVVGIFEITYSKRYIIEKLAATYPDVVLIETNAPRRVLMIEQGWEIYETDTGLSVRKTP